MEVSYLDIGRLITRREALRAMGGGFGMLALAGLIGDSALPAVPSSGLGNPMEVKPPHFPAKAKSVIFLFLNGGVSQVDTFDPKPMLDRYHGQPLPGGNPKTSNTTGNLMRLVTPRIRKSPWTT